MEKIDLNRIYKMTNIADLSFLSKNELIEYEKELLELVETPQVLITDSKIEVLAKMELSEIEKLLNKNE